MLYTFHIMLSLWLKRIVFLAYCLAIIFPPPTSSMPPPPKGMPAPDFTFHYIVYFVFAIVTWVCFKAERFPLISKFPELKTVVFLSVFGLLDEMHQTYIPGRHYDPRDIAANILGAATIMAIVYCVRWVRGGGKEVGSR